MGSRYAQRRAPRAAATSCSHGHPAHGGQTSRNNRSARWRRENRRSGAGRSRRPAQAQTSDATCAIRSARQQKDCARPPLHRRAARSPRVAAARRLRGFAAFPRSLPGKWSRHVLVITGKGGAPDDHATRDFWQSPERGVLRRLVPQWLAEPSFRPHVVSFTESAMKHGGSGALYVTIRKGPLHSRPE